MKRPPKPSSKPLLGREITVILVAKMVALLVIWQLFVHPAPPLDASAVQRHFLDNSLSSLKRIGHDQ